MSSAQKTFIVWFYRTGDDVEPYESIEIAADATMDESRIATAANLLCNERGDHSFAYEEKT
jgi:hypothetical protein